MTELLIPAGGRAPGTFSAGRTIARLGMIVRADCASLAPAPLSLSGEGDELSLSWQGRRYALRGSAE
ncbi:hypothetical protein HS125_13825 [bacterium]|nr:hypothetical protein [bacterium]